MCGRTEACRWVGVCLCMVVRTCKCTGVSVRIWACKCTGMGM